MEIINKQQLGKLIDFDTLFERTKEAFALFSQGKTITPPFTVFTLPETNGSVHFKCGYVPGDKYFAMKYSGAFYGNQKLGLSNFLGLFIIFNATTGEVEAVVDDKGFLTDFRTGVAGAIATTTLARKNSENVGVIGTGIQARMQIFALAKVMNIKNIYVWSRNSESQNTYVAEMQKDFPKINFVSCQNAKEVCENSDILYTVTYSEKPIIEASWIKKGTHITAVGACEPSMQELDSKLFEKASIIVCDSVEAAGKNGELHHAIKNKTLDAKKVKELGMIVSGISRKDEDITICDLVGIGFQDAVIGSHIMENFVKNK